MVVPFLGFLIKIFVCLFIVSPIQCTGEYNFCIKFINVTKNNLAFFFSCVYKFLSPFHSFCFFISILLLISSFRV
jgi:hypothetical protein